MWIKNSYNDVQIDCNIKILIKNSKIYEKYILNKIFLIFNRHLNNNFKKENSPLKISPLAPNSMIQHVDSIKPITIITTSRVYLFIVILI